MNARLLAIGALMLFGVSCNRHQPDMSKGGTDLAFAPDYPAGAGAAERQQLLGGVQEVVARRIGRSTIPALVSRSDGSSGMSEDEGCRVQPLLSK